MRNFLFVESELLNILSIWLCALSLIEVVAYLPEIAEFIKILCQVIITAVAVFGVYERIKSKSK